MIFSAHLWKPGPLCLHPNDKNKLHLSLLYRFMRFSLLVVFLLLTSMQVLWAISSNGQSVGTEKVTLSVNHENLETAFKKIEQQTPFRFYYRKADITALNNLTMAPATRSVEQALQQLLSNTNLTFRQIDDNILIEKQAQQMSYEVKGRVLSSSRQPMDYATVMLRKANVSSPLLQTLTDSSGQYKFTIPDKGNYLIAISAVGMDSLSLSFGLTSQQVITLPYLILSVKSTTLQAVTVIGKRAYIEQQLDRTVVNVGALISNTGTNALEALEKAPGVIVEGNGSISFKGKAGVLILVDGKPTYLSGDNLTAYLRSLPSSGLDQIELMDNPPAKYDAAGNAGVINIKTKKTKTAGFNGAFATSYGLAHYGQTSESLNLNYRVNKLNLFANVAYSLSQGYRSLDLDRQYYDNSGNLISAFEQTQYIKPKTNSTNLKLGMDYYASPKTTWGVVLTGLLSNTHLDNPSINNLFNSSHDLDSVVQSQNNSRNHFNNGGINVNYSHQFDSLGRALTFDLDYLNYSANSNQVFLNSTFNTDGTLTATQALTDKLPTSINIYTAKTDYIHPLPNKAKLEAGLKSSYVNTDNGAEYFNVVNGVSTTNYNLSNRFLYKENINAAYLNYSQNFSRISFQVGLRLENTNADGHQLGNVLHPDSSFIRHYTNLFPTSFLSYKLDSTGTHMLVVSYGRRIGRPYYQDLNPFVLLSDKYTYSAGNPYLLPQIADNYRLAYNYKSMFSGALYYNRFSNLQSEIVRRQGDVFIDGTGNIGTATYIGASVNLTLEPTKWWFMTTYIQVFRTHYKGKAYDLNLDQALTFGEGNMTNQFTLPKGWSAELSGFYIMRRTTGQQINYPTGQLNAGLQKKIWHNQAAVKFSARDVLHTYSADGITNFIPNTTASFRNRFNSQSFTVGLSYNFGKTAGTNQKRNTGGAENEKSRIRN